MILNLSAVLQKLPGLQVYPVPLTLQVIQQLVKLVQLPIKTNFISTKAKLPWRQTLSNQLPPQLVQLPNRTIWSNHLLEDKIIFDVSKAKQLIQHIIYERFWVFHISFPKQKYIRKHVDSKTEAIRLARSWPSY